MLRLNVLLYCGSRRTGLTSPILMVELHHDGAWRTRVSAEVVELHREENQTTPLADPDSSTRCIICCENG